MEPVTDWAERKWVPFGLGGISPGKKKLADLNNLFCIFETNAFLKNKNVCKLICLLNL